MYRTYTSSGHCPYCYVENIQRSFIIYVWNTYWFRFSVCLPHLKIHFTGLDWKVHWQKCSSGWNLHMSLWKHLWRTNSKRNYYVWLIIRLMKFSMARNFYKMFFEQPSVFLNSRREGTCFYFTYTRHKIQTF